jgi:hypothetical protein
MWSCPVPKTEHLSQTQNVEIKPRVVGRRINTHYAEDQMDPGTDLVRVVAEERHLVILKWNPGLRVHPVSRFKFQMCLLTDVAIPSEGSLVGRGAEI